MSFQVELGQLLNRYSKENDSNTPDYILAEYLMGCLENFNKIVRNRDKWHDYGKGYIMSREIGIVNSSTTTEI